MARESQGLQVLLIVFVMLSVVLGVSFYIYVKKADEATKAAVAAAGREQQAHSETADKQKECDVLKSLIGLPDKSTDDIKKQFSSDMQTYSGEGKPDAGAENKPSVDKPLFDAATAHYSSVLATMSKVIQDRSDELIQTKNLLAKLEADYKNREATKDDTIKALTEGYAKLNDDVHTTAEAYNSGQMATAKDSDRLVKEVTDIKEKATRSVTAAEGAVTTMRQEVRTKTAETKEVLEKLRKKETQFMDVPSGEITWVSMANKMVWINRGRADSLQRQTEFTVYSGESSDAAKAVKKGTVEVVRITGDHESEARIVNDKLTDPIMAGDKVFTPLWSPGQQNHFALAGIMNLDGDGRNQLSTVCGMIQENGGAVDCKLDERGRKQGQVTANTRYIVIGDPPDKSSPEFIKNNGDIIHDAEHYEVRKMSLADFKQQMGYQKSSSVEHFGSGASTSSGVSKAASALKSSGPAKSPAKDVDTSGF